VIYAWIDAEKAHNLTLTIAAACRILGVSRSGFYAWRARLDTVSPRQQANRRLLEEIRRVHHEYPAYGSPRVCHELRHRGRTVSVNRVAKLMKANGIRACRGRLKSRPRSAPPRRRPEVPDLVRRRFNADRPNQLWCVDTTQIRTRQGWLYAVVVIDVYSRKIISWTTSNHRSGDLALDALDTAVRIRRPPPGGIVHTDRGYQFTAWEWLAKVEAAGLRASIGRVGSAHDNALIESWFSSFKNEAIHPYPMPATIDQARRILFSHIDFHNRRRLHSALDYTNPTTYETITVST
jgi:putative transposase